MNQLNIKLIPLEKDTSPKIAHRKNHSMPPRSLSFSEKMVEMNKSSNLILKFLNDHLSKFPNINEEDALDNFIYGISVKQMLKNGDVCKKVIYMSDNIMTNVILLDKGNSNYFRIDMKNVNEISIGSGRGGFAKLKEKKKSLVQSMKDELCISILFLRADSIDLAFASQESLNFFLYGVKHIFKQENEKNDQMDKNEKNIRSLWSMYDRDHSNQMEIDEFAKFLKQMNIENKENGLRIDSVKEIQAYFKKIDKDNSGKIDYHEFILFYRELMSGKEFEEIFKKYTKGKDVMYVQDLIDFMLQEQKENAFDTYDANRILLDHMKSLDEQTKTEINKKMQNNPTVVENSLFLNLEEFKNFVTNNKFCHIYNLEELVKEQDMTRPLNEYFIFSSHNTYLTNHQLYGESNVEMYNFAVMNGCRLVELDCWDGDKEPIITHGHTFTSTINFRDVLINLRNNSFKTNPYPVLFSIEMHCKAEQQKIMAELYREILKDVYVIDEDNPPDEYPSPSDLKGKFIIKEGRTKIIKKDHKVFNLEKEMKKDEKAESEEKNQKEIDEFDLEAFDLIPDETPISKQYFADYPKKTYPPVEIKININNLSEEKELNSPALNSERNNIVLSTVQMYEKESKLKDENSLSVAFVSKNFRNTFLSEIKEMSLDYDVSPKPPFNLHRDSKLHTRTSQMNMTDSNRDFRNTSFGDNKEEKGMKEKKEKVKTIREIQELTGLIKIKFSWDKCDVPGYFQPWDCPAIKETQIEEICKNFEQRKKLVEYCKNSFLKVYPSFKRIDSSNFDPVKSWICGVQIAAMNLQSLSEDHMLINTVFFKNNQKSGYLLKPNFLRKGIVYDKTYQKPVLKLSIQIISGLMLYNCQNNNHDMNDFSINCYIVGSWEDDNFNNKFQSKKYRKNLLNPIFNNEIYLFEIYEPDLSFVIIKLVSNDEIFARACIPLQIIKEGVRVVPLFDEMCKEISDSELVIRVSKTLLG